MKYMCIYVRDIFIAYAIIFYGVQPLMCDRTAEKLSAVWRRVMIES